MLHASSFLELLAEDPLQRPSPCTLDTNVLLNDIRANVAREGSGKRETALLGQAEAGVLRLFVSDRVAHEVPTRMVRVLRDEAAAGLELWERRYLPLIRVVALDGVEVEQEYLPRLKPVRDVDPDDVATAYLSLLCAPCACITDDHHLYDHGFGAKTGRIGVCTIGEVTDIDTGIYSTNRVAGVLVEALVLPNLDRVARTVGRRPELGLLILAALLVAFRAGWLDSQRVNRKIGATVKVLADAGMEVRARRQTLIEKLDPYLVEPLEPKPLSAALAATLVRANRPRSAPALAEQLGVDVSDVRAELKRNPGFCAVAGRGWELGAITVPTAMGAAISASPARLTLG